MGESLDTAAENNPQETLAARIARSGLSENLRVIDNNPINAYAPTQGETPQAADETSIEEIR